MEDPELTAGQREELAGILEYWKKEETRRNIRAAFPEYMKQAMPEDIYWEHSEIAFPLYRVIGLYMDFEKLLRLAGSPAAQGTGRGKRRGRNSFYRHGDGS